MRLGESAELAASTVLTAVHLDTKARKACAFPSDIKGKAQALLARTCG
jgi:acyl-CoA thioesterase FadM